MQSRSVDTVTSNEGLVRLRIFDGVIPAEDGMKELLELLKSQYVVLSKDHIALWDKLAKANKRLRDAGLEIVI